MSDVIKSLEQAEKWFLSHSSGTVIATHPAMGDRIRVCSTFKEARQYFTMAEGRKPGAGLTPANKMNHCWKDWRDWLEETGMQFSDDWIEAHYHNRTCLREAGHWGGHEWTADSEIEIEFIGSGWNTRSPQNECAKRTFY